MATQALITPSVLEWARMRAEISLDVLSQKLSVKDEKVQKWVVGESKPTFKQAQKLAKILQIPFGYLFLQEPPQESLPIPDLRTLDDTAPSQISATFRELLYEVDRKQQWYREYVLESGEDEKSFVGKYNFSVDIDALVNDIRTTLQWDVNLALSIKNKDDFISVVTKKAESSGILVMRNSVLANNTHKHLNVAEFRGFVISDKYAPLIFINTADAKSAQIFTLAHELAHLWFGESGISNVELYKPEEKEIEKFCNKVAAELLLPKEAFYNEWKQEFSEKQNCEVIAQKFHISIFVVFRRALDFGFIPQELFKILFNEAKKSFEEYEKNMKPSSGGDFFRTLKVRNSEIFSQAVVSSALEGRLLYKDAASLLGVKKASVVNEYAHKLGIK